MNLAPDIRKILEAACAAPSGENTQPWRFEVEGLKIKLYNHHERDISVYNWEKRPSLLADGAALENLCIAARELDYDPMVTLFPNKNNPDLAAEIELAPNKSGDSPLYKFIFERVTNRKKYDDSKLSSKDMSDLSKSINNSKIKLYFTQEDTHKHTLGRAGSTNEEIMLSNEHLHQFFFNHINWNKAEDDEKKVGFFIDTLELAPPARASFKLLRHWQAMNLFNKINFHKMVGKQNAVINSAAAGFGAFTIPDMSPESFVLAGREIERFWLTATKLELSMQPLTGVLFFMYRVLAEDTEKFSEKQIQIIKKAYDEIKVAFAIPDGETICFMFRIGKSEKPTARSSRFSVDEVTTVLS